MAKVSAPIGIMRQTDTLHPYSEKIVAPSFESDADLLLLIRFILHTSRSFLMRDTSRSFHPKRAPSISLQKRSFAARWTISSALLRALFLEASCQSRSV